jgi:TatD DNase family protein
VLIDTHAHVNFNAYKEDGDEVVRRSLAENIWMINIGSQSDTSRRAIEYAQKYPEGVFAAVGIHPIHLQSGTVKAYQDEYESVEFNVHGEKFDIKQYQQWAQEKKVVAIGECGLDYYHITNNSKQITEEQITEIKKLQKEVFIQQLELASELEKPVIIHCREAHNDLLEILRQVTSDKRQAIQGVVHSFSGRWSQAQEYLEMGFYLGFNGIITFARDYDRVVKETPLERLLLETDCPYLTPIPFRGKRNEPSYVKYVAQKVAELKGTSIDEVAEITTKNAQKLFGI